MKLKSIKVTKSTANTVKISSLLILMVALSGCYGLPVHHGYSPSYGHEAVYVPTHSAQRYEHTSRRIISVEH